MNKSLTITEVAKQVGMSAKTIRYYESIDLFKPFIRSDNKYRRFSKKDIQRLHLIKKARALEIPLNEIKSIISKCIDKGCMEAKEYVATKIPGFISSIDEKITELQLLKKEFNKLQRYYKNNKNTWTHKTDSCCEILSVKE